MAGDDRFGLFAVELIIVSVVENVLDGVQGTAEDAAEALYVRRRRLSRCHMLCLQGFCSGRCLFTAVHGFDPPAATAQSDMSPKSHSGRSRLFVLVSYPCYPLRVVVDNKNVE